MKWGGTDFKWGGRAPQAPLLAMGLPDVRRQRSELRSCAKLVGGFAVTILPDGPRVHLSGPAYMPSCIRPEV